MHDVFISYSHRDKYIADGICANLEANSIKCWYAPRDIGPGEEWSEAIMNALSKAKVFILIFSKNSNRSDQVYNEITSAIKYGCHIIPFCVDSVEMHVRLAYYLNAVHWLDATDKALLDNIEKLYEEVYNHLNHESPKEFVRIPVKEKKKKKRNIIIAAVAVLLALLAVLVIGLFSGGDDDTDKDSVQVGDIIEFGTLDNKPIEWKVIDEEGGRLLVISREGLYSDFYNMNGSICTWESCILRSDLNSQYYDLWFTEEEKENIFETHLENPDNELYGTDGGNTTRDRLFILSIDEIEKYLPEQEDRKLMGAGYLSHGEMTYHPWWVRNPGENLNCALYVDEEGNVGYDIDEDMAMGVGTAAAGLFLVRPAMWIKYDGPAEKDTTESANDADDSLLLTANPGDIIQFGSYEQDNNTQNGKEAIDWVVLEVDDYSSMKSLTLISKSCLDTINITSSNYGYNLWYNCVARSWLNDTFYADAFDSEERKLIQPTLVETVDKTQSPAKTVKTSDNVVLLNVEQYNEYSHLTFVSDFLPSTYAYEKNSYIDGWWLTDTYFSEYYSDNNYMVNSDGEVKTAMQKFDQYVRPVITISVDTK